jgi:hypothetical protein
MIAAQKGFAEIVKLLLAHGANPTLTTPEAEVNALHFACEEGHEEVVDILTRLSDEGGAGMDVNATTSYEWTPAHSAAAHGQYRCLEILLTRGARPDHEDKAKRTPLNYAAKHGHTEAVKCLIKAGARVNHQDALLQTPLHKAASVGSLDTIKVLVTSDADINLLDKDECTAFDLADSLSHASTALYLWLQGTQTKSVKGAGMASYKWSRPLMVGSPSPRYDAALCACGSNILLYGGYGTSTYSRNTSMDRRDLSDMYILDTKKNSSGHCLRIHERSKAVKGLSKTKISKLLRIEDDGFTVVYIPTEANCPVGTVLGDGVFKLEEGATCAYFEVTIVDAGLKGYIGFGFVDEHYKFDRQPGWDPESYGYHGDDGQVYHSEGSGCPWGPLYTTGDVVGCGVNFLTGEVFFTKNGQFLGVCFKGAKDFELIPAVGLHSPGEKVYLNFGQKPFAFSFETEIYSWRRINSVGIPMRSPQLVPLSDHEALLLECGPFTSEVYKLDLQKLCWDKIPATGIHPAYLEASLHKIDDRIYVIAPDRIYYLDLNQYQWHQLVGLPNAPSPRVKFSSCVIGKRIYVWGGEKEQPHVFGRKVAPIVLTDYFYFDTEKMEWIEVVVEGQNLATHSLYSIQTINNKALVFGGWDGNKQHNEVWMLEPINSEGTRLRWFKPHITGTIPRPRNNHAAAVAGNKIFYCGGWGGKTFLFDIDVLDLDTQAVKDNRSLDYCFNNSGLWDIEVLVGGRKILANRAVLSARSSVFRELLDPQLAQKVKEDQLNANNTNANPLLFDNVNLRWFALNNSSEIVRSAKDFLKLTDNGFLLEIPDFSYEVIYALLYFMYADRIDVSRLDNRERYLSVVKAAHLFAPELAQKISEELILTRTTEGSSMFKDTAIYFNWDVFADVTFSVEGRTIKAHKPIICSRSPFFRALCMGGLAESRQNEIPLANISYEVFSILLQCLYGAELNYEQISEEHSIMDVLEAACQYQIDNLVRDLEDIIGTNLTQENVLSILLEADRHQANRLKKYCLDVIASDEEAIVNSEEYIQNKQILDAILGKFFEEEKQNREQKKREEEWTKQEEQMVQEHGDDEEMIENDEGDFNLPEGLANILGAQGLQMLQAYLNGQGDVDIDIGDEDPNDPNAEHHGGDNMDDEDDDQPPPPQHNNLPPPGAAKCNMQ